MNAEDKQDILDFIDFYVVLGIVQQKTLCKYYNEPIKPHNKRRRIKV